MDETERPIHYADSKRETLYIKNDDKWTKDDNKEKLKSAIDSVTNKNVEQIPQLANGAPKVYGYGIQRKCRINTNNFKFFGSWR